MMSSLFSSAEVAHLISLIEAHISPGTKRGGVRDVMDRAPQLRAAAEDIRVRDIVEHVLGSTAFVVRSILFDKTAGANWKVPWHQDLTIAVDSRRDTEGYGPWSIKEGIVHVQPPTEVLARMVTVRIHMDPCPAINGALRVLPGTHKLGRLNQNHLDCHIDEARAITCAAQPGDALIMRPLLLHASSPSIVPAHRRILHFDFANGGLYNGLTWRMR